jgi:dTDP-4-dehydrorhamnose reductase
MYISTDYVFPGTGEHAYEPDDPTGPLSVYGKSKLAGELAVKKACNRHFIVRISWAFGKNGNNFVKTMLRLAETKTDLNVVCDQIGSPTYTYDLARLLCDMIVTDRYGTYHATGDGLCSWAEFAEAIMQLGNKTTKIHPIPTSEYPSRAVRPLNSRMSKDKLEANGFERLPHWKDALARYLKEQNESEG